MRNLLTAAVVSLTCLSVPGCVWQHTAERNLMQTAPHVAGSGVSVRTHNGAVKVIASPQRSDVEIECKLQAAGSSEEEAQQRVAAASLKVGRDESGRLVIEPVFPESRRGGDGATIIVRVPEASGATVRTSNGSVEVRGLTGQVTLSSSNGHIEVIDHQGDAQVTTSNGSVKVADVTGSVQIDTSNGAVRVDGVSGTVKAGTSNGSITLALTADHNGPLHLGTSNGAIHVRVGAGFAGTVNLSTSNARVTVVDPQKRITQRDLDKHGGRIVVGNGGETSEIDTSNGSIEFTISG